MKNTARLMALILAILMLPVFALAEETPAPGDTPGPTAEATAEPTAEPTPEPTAEPTTAPDFAIAAASIEGTITGDCALTLPDNLADKAYRLLDAYVESYLPLKKDQSILLELPDAAQGLYLEWYEQTESYYIEELDANARAIGTLTAQPFINAYYELNTATRALRIVAADDCSLSSLRLYAAGTALPDDVQRWQPPHETADLVLLAATPETALTDLFVPLSIYTVEHGVQTALVCLSAHTRAAQNDLLAALWALGVGNYPYFGGFHTWNETSYLMLKAEWRAGATRQYVENTLLALRPRVVVTHANDENAENQAAYFTAEQLLTLMDSKKGALRDAGIDKLYLCAVEGTALPLDKPLVTLDGATAAEAVEELAFSRYQTLRDRPAGVTARAVYALAVSSVGEDAEKDDLFENIAQETLVSFVAPTPTPIPTPEPTPTPTPAVTATPELVPEQAVTPAVPAAAPGGPARYAWIIPALGLTLSILIFLTLRRRPIKRRKLAGYIILTLLPLLIGLAAFAAIKLLPAITAPRAIESPVPAETPAPTETPAPSPTPEPAPTPAPAEGDEQYFRQEGEPEEVITVDVVNGYWEYRSDILSIIINRFVTTYTTLKNQTFPQVYFVAQIRMREVNSFRTGQSAERRNGMAAILPYKLARENHGVLLITGDNLLMNDKQYKGILIRGGQFFGDFRKADTLAMYPDMSMRIFRPGEATAESLMADGVRDAISFGPTLMRDGVLLAGVDGFRDLGDERNPRVGLGMIEPGHYVAIVADGRQKDNYSHGMSLSRFAELFVPYGCRDVYNMDGGVSACMIFMGEQLNRHADRTDATTKGYTQSFQRRVPDGLIWGYSDQVPSVDDPVYNWGTNKDGVNVVPTPTPGGATDGGAN